MEQKMTDYGSITDYITSMGDWDCTHADLVGKDTLFMEFRTTKTQYGEALLCDCFNEVDGAFVALIGGQVLMEQLKEVEDRLPLRAIIAKTGRYYCFVAPPETIQTLDDPAEEEEELPF